jgi:hypothetical protein
LQPYAKRENRGRGGETCRGVLKREEPERQKGRWEIVGLALLYPFSKRIQHCNFDGKGYRGYFPVAVSKQRFSGKEIKCSVLVIQHCSVINQKRQNFTKIVGRNSATWH